MHGFSSIVLFKYFLFFPRRNFRAIRFKANNAFTVILFKAEKLEDLKAGMTLEGVISNVTNFGAFVDVGVHQDGLVHVSALADKFVEDPHDVVKPGDIVKVKVMEVDLPRKRISLTMRLDERHQDQPKSADAPAGRPRFQPARFLKSTFVCRPPRPSPHTGRYGFKSRVSPETSRVQRVTSVTVSSQRMFAPPMQPRIHSVPPPL